MTINKEGKLEISLHDITDRLNKEDARYFIKSICISPQIMDWVVNWILGEDEDGWFGGESELREKILERIETKHCSYVTRYNWKLIREAADALKRIASAKHIYFKLYHHPNPYETTIAEFLKDTCYEENEYQTKRADDKIEEVLNIVKEAVKLK